MAVYTYVSDEDLAVFLEAYDLDPVTAFKGIAGGVENSNYLLGTGDGQFILTLYEKRVAEEDLPFFIGLMNHLAAGGYPCPRPVHRRDGEALGRLCDRPAAIVTFLDGVDVQTPSLDHCHAAGTALARLHAAGRGFQITRQNALGPSSWGMLAKPSMEHADTVEPGLRALIGEALKVTDDWPTDLPAGICHADFFRDNVFFLGSDLSGVIDFYFACNDLWAYDLAVTLNAWCFDAKHVFQAARAEAIIAGYASERTLTGAERRALPRLAAGAALRFLLTRLHDWLNVPPGALVVPHDPRDFSARLRFFLSVEDPSEIGA